MWDVLGTWWLVGAVVVLGVSGVACSRWLGGRSGSVESVPEVPQDTRLIAVSGLAWATDDEGLSAEFASFGTVLDARVVLDVDTGRSRGFAFLLFADADAAVRAVEERDATELDGRIVRVNLAELANQQESVRATMPHPSGAQVEGWDTVALEPTGHVGQVKWIADATFGFHGHIGVVEVPIEESARWRPLMHAAEADAVSEAIAQAAPIPGVTAAEGLASGWASDAVAQRVLRYLDGDRAQQIAAIATLLDWEVEAKAQGLEDGRWLGLLYVARDRLLGELRWVWGGSARATRARLIAARRGRDRVAAVPAPPEPEAPIGQLDREPSRLEPGVYPLGTLDVHDSLSVIEGSWSSLLEAPWHAVRVAAKPGPWKAWVVVPEPIAPALAAELAARREGTELEKAEGAFTGTFGRPHLVFAHADHAASAKAVGPAPSATYASLAAIADAMEDEYHDPLEVAPTWLFGEDGAREALERVGTYCEEPALAQVLTGSRLDREQASAIREVLSLDAPYLAAWTWGVAGVRALYPTPVLAGGPASGRTWLVLYLDG